MREGLSLVGALFRLEHAESDMSATAPAQDANSERTRFMPRDRSSMTPDEKLQLLFDEKEIADIQYRVARAIRLADVELMVACYHPGAFDHHAPFSEETIEEKAKSFREKCLKQGELMHYVIQNLLIEIDGDVAHTEAIVWSMKLLHEHSDTGEQMGRLSGARYLDRLERREGRWAIAERWFVPEWGFFQSIPPQTKPVGAYVPPSEWKSQPLKGARDRTDISYQL